MGITLVSSVVRDEAFFLRAELGRLSATLRERSDHYDIDRKDSKDEAHEMTDYPTLSPCDPENSSPSWMRITGELFKRDSRVSSFVASNRKRVSKRVRFTCGERVVECETLTAMSEEIGISRTTIAKALREGHPVLGGSLELIE